MNFEEYFEKFEKLQRWIITDLRNSSVLAHANLLVAQGLFNYFEILGSFFVTRTYKGKDMPQDRFDFVFEHLLGHEYLEIFRQLKKLTKSAYDTLRCGLTHEYLIKTYNVKSKKLEINFSIFGVDGEVAYSHVVDTYSCGIELIKIDPEKYHLRVYNPRLIHDLNLAFEKLKKKILTDGSFKTRFMERCQEIGLEKLN